METSCWFCLSESLKIIWVKSSKEFTGMHIQQGVGSNWALYRNFTLRLCCAFIKNNGWKKLLSWETEKPRKQPTQAVQKQLSKVILFQKFSKIENTGSRFLLLVNFQALFVQKWLYQRCFLGKLSKVFRTPVYHRF